MRVQWPWHLRFLIPWAIAWLEWRTYRSRRTLTMKPVDTEMVDANTWIASLKRQPRWSAVLWFLIGLLLLLIDLFYLVVDLVE